MNIYDKNKILNISRHGYEDLMKLENVNALGLGYKYVNSKNTGELALHVLVEKKVDKSLLTSKSLVPKNYMNIQTDIIEIGKVSAQSLLSKTRPLLGGHSISPSGYPWAGTLGCVVYRKTATGIEYYVLSNNHVLANGNLVPKGTPISQPANMDGGMTPTDNIGMLSEFVELKFDATPNIVDCAIAKISDSSLISNKIDLIGAPTGIANPKLNSMVQKVGRTTEHLSGKVLTIGATIQVNYGSDRTALFTNQILCEPISKPGDSGSLVLDSSRQAVGLLFAGSDSVTVFNNINAVLSALNVSILV